MVSTISFSGLERIDYSLLGNNVLKDHSQPAPNPTGRSINIAFANETVTGTKINQLAKLTSTNCPSGISACAINASTSDVSGIIGFVIANNGTTGNAIIAVGGIATCLFDSHSPFATAGDYAIASVSVAGNCRDNAGTPSTNEYFGIVIDTFTAGSKTARVALNIQRQ